MIELIFWIINVYQYFFTLSVFFEEADTGLKHEKKKKTHFLLDNIYIASLKKPLTDDLN